MYKLPYNLPIDLKLRISENEGILGKLKIEYRYSLVPNFSSKNKKNWQYYQKTGQNQLLKVVYNSSTWWIHTIIKTQKASFSSVGNFLKHGKVFQN